MAQNKGNQPKGGKLGSPHNAEMERMPNITTHLKEREQQRGVQKLAKKPGTVNAMRRRASATIER